MTKKRATKKRARRPAAPPETIARAIAESDIEPTSTVAARYNTTESTLRGWRARAREPELAELVAVARRQALEVWRPQASSTLRTLLERMRKLAMEGEEIPLSLIAAVKTVGGLNVEAGALLGDPGADREASG